ncbi:MAG: phage regulatory CII family protein [Pseudomonadota bacterium]
MVGTKPAQDDFFLTAAEPPSKPPFSTAWTPEERVTQAVVKTLKNASKDRDQIAREMGVRRGVLDGYASLGRPQNNITAARALALVRITGDTSVIEAMIENTGLVLVDARYREIYALGQAVLRQRQAKRALGELDDQIKTAERRLAGRRS